MIVVSAFCCAHLSTAQPAHPLVSSGQGNILLGIADTVHSEVLAEKRVLNIYLPDGYFTDTTAKYPVIYLLDGGIAEDFVHLTGLLKYFSNPWVSQSPGAILVGIENVNRRRDFTFASSDTAAITAMGFDKNAFQQAGASARFISFMEKELQPYIHTRYRTNADKTIIGESLAGLLATEILLKKTALFNRYIIVSPSLWWGGGSLLTGPVALPDQHDGKPLKVYIGASNKAEDSTLYNHAQQLALLLSGTKLSKEQVYFDYLPAEQHATILHQAVYNALKWLYQKK